MERIQKIIANSGFCSRRKAEEFLEQRKVEVNNKLAKLGDKANKEDKITVNKKPISTKSEKKYFILNKPKGILVTKNDPKKRKTIYNLKSISSLNLNLNYVGRLDAMSEGLLILTNDGELIQKLTHPKHSITKTYQLRTEPTITKQDILKLENGIPIEGKKLYAKISNKNNNIFHISIKEGRNRIIRKVMKKLNYKIFQLKRISVEGIKLGDLKPREVKEISEAEIKKFLKN